jgi:hypothetical protein
MAVNSAKLRAKTEALLSAYKGNEPIITQEDYNVKLNQALYWYSEHADEKKLRKYAIEYFAKLNKKTEVLAINKASDFEIRQLAVLCRLLSREQYVSDKHKSFIENTVAELVSKYKVVKEIKKETKPTNIVGIQERIDDLFRKYAAEIDGELDEFIKQKSSEFSAKNYLLANAVSSPVAKRIGELYSRTLDELRDAIGGNDEQLVEAYSHFSKRELKKYADFVEGIVTDCLQHIQTAKATRAPRKRKAINPAKVVSKMKYMREFSEFKLKSCNPADIISSTELWVYNTKYRRIQVYKADYGNLNVKGTTIIGFSIKESISLTLRKPEEFFKDLSFGKRALNSAIKKLTTKPSVPNGRINEECILLGAF